MDYLTYKTNSDKELSTIDDWRKDFERDFAKQGTGHSFQVAEFGGYQSQFVQYMWLGYCMGRKAQIAEGAQS